MYSHHHDVKNLINWTMIPRLPKATTKFEGSKPGPVSLLKGSGRDWKLPLRRAYQSSSSVVTPSR